MVTRGKDVNTAHDVTNIRQYRPLYPVQSCRCWLLGPGDQRPWDRMWVGLVPGHVGTARSCSTAQSGAQATLLCTVSLVWFVISHLARAPLCRTPEVFVCRWQGPSPPYLAAAPWPVVAACGLRCPVPWFFVVANYIDQEHSTCQHHTGRHSYSVTQVTVVVINGHWWGAVWVYCMYTCFLSQDKQ